MTSWVDEARNQVGAMGADEGGAIGWDDEIKQDDSFILLEPGEYKFKVVEFSRGRYEGGAKIGPCNTADFELEINSSQGVANVRTKLLMHSKVEFRISQFFTSIGQKKKGEPLRPRWNEVVGSTGMCRIAHREYNGNIYNDVAEFLPPVEQPVQQEFTPGKF